MIRIQFLADQDRVQGNYVLATKSVVRRLRGQIFEVSEAGLRLLDDHHIPYQTLPIPEPTGSGRGFKTFRPSRKSLSRKHESTKTRKGRAYRAAGSRAA
jgi:hypothetical protein